MAISTEFLESFLLGLFASSVIMLIAIGVWQNQKRRQLDSLQMERETLSQQNISLTEQLADKQGQLETSERQIHQLRTELSAAQIDNASLSSQLKQLPALENKIQEKEQALKEAHEAASRLETRMAEITTRAQSETKHHAEQITLLNESKEKLKQEFSHLANEIFEQKQQRFQEQSQQSIHALLDPFNKQIEQFRKRVDDIHTKDAEGRSQLLTQLSMLKDMNSQLNKQADDLTKALKGDKKLQGNWGELQIERILESSGLQKGREFEREPNYKDGEGNNFRPDFIIHLPDGKHIIVDSKVSLNAYQQAVTADDESARELAIRDHVNATRTHIRSLSEKNYPGLSGINAPDFVLMFMPVESAFIAAFEADPKLFNEAFERHIVVVTPTTLLATLRTVANLWVLERQNENAKELYSLAGKIYDKVAVFSRKMEKLGGQISTADKTFHDAMNSLTEGRGSMMSYVKRLKDIGAPTSKQLAESMQPAESLPEPEEEED